MSFLPRFKFLLLLSLAVWIPRCEASMSLDTKSKYLKSCCDNGRNQLSKFCTVDKFPIESIPVDLHFECHSKILKCCQSKRDHQFCNRGVTVALNETARSCQQHVDKKFQLCCNACKTGIETAKRGNECNKFKLIKRQLYNEKSEYCCRLKQKELIIHESDNSIEDSSEYEDDESYYDTTTSKLPFDIILGPFENEAAPQSLRGPPISRFIATKPGHPKKCRPGLFRNDFGYCEDIDECKISHNGCGKDAICRNRYGGYNCEPKSICMAGYRFNQATMACKDIDECLEKSEICRFDETCNNTVGSYECRTKFEYLSRRECQVYPSSTFRPMTATRGTSRTTTFKHRTTSTISTPWPLMVTKTFSCRKGFEKDLLGRCVDIDECKKNPCPVNRKCLNRNGSFQCLPTHCPNGFRPDSDGRCIDVNECDLNPSKCPLKYDCINKNGSYRCLPKICDAGFKVNELGDCADQNECELSPNLCRNGECINTVGSYKCYCHDGYKMNQWNYCDDINECHNNSHGCQHRCYNKIGGYECKCNSGYKLSIWNHHTCDDIDECQEYEGRLCIGECRNKIGGYDCLCPDGFQKVGEFCEDVDECAALTNPCSYDSKKCFNIPGSYKCIDLGCKDGYKMVIRDSSRFCKLKTPCGYENDDKSCDNAWIYRHNYLTRPANCSQKAFFYISSSENVDQTKISIEDFRATSTETGSVKMAESEDFGIEKSSKKIQFNMNNQLDGPQDIDFQAHVTYFGDKGSVVGKEGYNVQIFISQFASKFYNGQNWKYYEKTPSNK